jgi:hypothetical protein
MTRETCCERHQTSCRQGRDCPARTESDPMESPTVRAIAAVLALIAVGMVMERMGIPISWPF